MESKNGSDRTVDHPLEKVVVIDAGAPGAWQKVGGRLLVERIFIECRRLGLKEIFVLIPGDLKCVNLPINDSIPEKNIIRFRGDAVKALLRAKIVGDVFLYINAGYLIDPRLVSYLASTPPPCCLFNNGDEPNQPVLGLLTKSDLMDWAIGKLEEVLKRSEKVSPDMIEKYNPEIRGEQEPYLIKVASKLDAARATWVLITRNQKKVMDLPSMYIDPPFENSLTFLLCYAPVTPNQVTVFNLIVAFIVGCLFWNGHFVVGALLTYAAEILDGVDGKLARAKIIFSKLGEYECYVDFLYEHWWYVAIAVGLKHLGYGNHVWWFWAVLAVSDIWDNILYTMSEHWYGKSLDLLSPFDASFRKIAGRRNIYALIFLVGFLLGYPFGTFAVAAAWAFITASIHTYRLAKYRLNNPVATG